MNPRLAKKKEKADRRKQLRKLHDYNVPAWILNPLNELDYEAEADKLMQERQAQNDKSEAQRFKELQEAEMLCAKQLALENEKAKQKTHEMQRKLMKVICGLAPKRARAPIRRRK